MTMKRLDLALLLPDFVAGTIMIGLGWHRAGLPVNAWAIAGFLFS